MSQSLVKNLIHLIFSTKHRERTISDAVRPRLHAYMAGIFDDLDSPAITINSVADHVHILFDLDKDTAIAKVVMEVKRGSSKWIKTQGTEFRRFYWQSGYGGFSISQSAVENVKTYIAEQDKRHRRKTFQEEFRGFLRRYEIDYDEKYVWD
jgi:REP element-mobilizing transposase RayT